MISTGLRDSFSKSPTDKLLQPMYVLILQTVCSLLDKTPLFVPETLHHTTTFQLRLLMMYNNPDTTNACLLEKSRARLRYGATPYTHTYHSVARAQLRHVGTV